MTKLLLKLWLAVVVALLPATANAIEPSDLDGMIVAHIDVGNGGQHSVGMNTFSGRFAINSYGQLALTDFLAAYDILCEIETINGKECLSLIMDPDRVHPSHVSGDEYTDYKYDAVFQPVNLEYNCVYRKRYTYGYNDAAGVKKIYGEIVDHGYYYTVEIDALSPTTADPYTGFKVLLYDKNGYYQGSTIFDGLMLTIFKPNAIAVDYKDGEKIDEYPVMLHKYTQDGNDYLEVGNWMNSGTGLEVVEGSLNQDRWQTLIGNPSGAIDDANKTVSLDAQGWNYFISYDYVGDYNMPYRDSYGYVRYMQAEWTRQNGTYGTQYAICGIADDADENGIDVNDPITGTFETYDGLRHKNYDANAWVTNDGTVRTFDGGYEIVFGAYAYHDYSSVLDYIDSTVITPMDDNDVTADFHLDVRQYSAYDRDTKGEFRIQADVVPQQNCHNVESYDLYVVPKAMSSINEFGGKHDYTTGHADAVLIDSKPAAGANGGNTVSFDKWYTLTGDKFNKNLNDYSLFVKANYKSGTELDPTFHQLTPLTYTVITSIGVTGADSDVTVTAANGTITVKGADNVAVYTTTGAEVYNGPSGVINVAPGLYVVSAAGKTQKVIVR